MKAASINEIKNELKESSHQRLLALCLRLAKYKKDNKELLNYLLYQAHDEQSFILEIKSEIDKAFNEINYSSYFYIKKSLRKILRSINKYIKYSGIAQTEMELLIYFSQKIKASNISINENKILYNIYFNQMKRLDKAIKKLHDDLQYDYSLIIEKIK